MNSIQKPTKVVLLDTGAVEVELEARLRTSDPNAKPSGRAFPKFASRFSFQRLSKSHVDRSRDDASSNTSSDCSSEARQGLTKNITNPAKASRHGTVSGWFGFKKNELSHRVKTFVRQTTITNHKPKEKVRPTPGPQQLQHLQQKKKENQSSDVFPRLQKLQKSHTALKLALQKERAQVELLSMSLDEKDRLLDNRMETIQRLTAALTENANKILELEKQQQDRLKNNANPVPVPKVVRFHPDHNWMSQKDSERTIKKLKENLNVMMEHAQQLKLEVELLTAVRDRNERSAARRADEQRARHSQQRRRMVNRFNEHMKILQELHQHEVRALHENNAVLKSQLDASNRVSLTVDDESDELDTIMGELMKQ